MLPEEGGRILRIKKISRDAVMVYLTHQDLEYFDFDPEKRMPEAADLHRLLYEVMEFVQSETDFDPYGGQVIVEASPSSHGLSLSISKLKTGKKHRMTREEFKRIKSIRVKDEDCGGLTHDDIIELIEGLGIEEAIRRRLEKKSECEVFFFDSFENLESALCMVPDEVTRECALYRHEGRYALITEIRRGSRYANLISEFAEKSANTLIIRNDVREGWQKVAEKDALSEMASAMRNMQ